jgi:hypothetical protein
MPASRARCAPDTTARRAVIRRPSTVVTSAARPSRTPTAATGAPVTTVPPCALSCRTSAAGSAPEPPIGVAQPNRSRPAAIEAGSTPVPGRRGSWMVASDSHSMNARTTGCSNRRWITSHALPARAAR